ncbi:MAG: dihydroorotate dehydrogenase [Acidimicrobiia bacterium]
MASERLRAQLGPVTLRSPLIAASGTVGSVWEWATVADVTPFGAAVAKSVAPTAWEGRPPPRLAPVRPGMLNGIGIQNPGVEAWLQSVPQKLSKLDIEVWGSAVGTTAEEYAAVSHSLAGAGISAVEVNLSCPNLDDGRMFSMDPDRSAAVLKAVVDVSKVPIGAKLSPNTPDIVAVARACREAGASFVTLTNTALGFGIDVETRRPLLSGGPGGYSGPGLKPMSMRCVYEVSQAMPDLPIVGCGGVTNGADVIEYLLAGASAVGLGTVLLSEPKAGSRISRELISEMDRLEMESVGVLTGSVQTW